MTQPAPEPGALGAHAREQADHDLPSVVALLQRLVQTPSRGGLDPYGPVVEVVAAWLEGHELAFHRLVGRAGEPLGLVCEVRGDLPGPRWVLDACVDTAPFGDEARWALPPTSGRVVDGWLYGRGSSDCKAAVAIFCHLAARLAADAARLHGTVTLLFDADEHTGGFGGAKRFFDSDLAVGVAGVMIGYPGCEHVVVGSRGFLRAELAVHGTAGHPGGRAPTTGNAVEKAARLVGELLAQPLPGPAGNSFGLPPKLTVTAVRGGEAYTIVPDRCQVLVDIRLTPTFDAQQAAALLERVVAAADQRWPTVASTEVRYADSWPAYQLGQASTLSAALLGAARALAGPVAPKVAGPSNIGNYLAARGIEATAGFGVRYRNLHGTDEAIEVASIPLVQAVYHHAALRLLAPSQPSDSPPPGA